MNNFVVVAVLLIVAAGIAFGIWWTSYYQPLLEEREAIEAKIDELKQKQEDLRGIDDEIAALQDEIAKLTEQKKDLEMESNQLNTVVPKILDSTETIANKFKVKFQDIRISPLVRAEDWSELPIEITVQGAFKPIYSFLTIVEKRKIINLAAGSMNVSVSAEIDRETKSPLLSVTLSAKVFILGSI